MRFWTLEDRLSRDTKTQNLRFKVNNIKSFLNISNIFMIKRDKNL